MLFTTSWDDGYATDLRLADLLDTYGIKGTFYVCPKKQHGKNVLEESDIAHLSKHHEIGAHTMSHPHLSQISLHDAQKEITKSKEWVEKITQKECAMFCYPYGDTNDAVKNLVQEAGFRGARTTKDLVFHGDDCFALPTTLQVAPFPKRKTFSRYWHPLDPFGPLRVRYARLRKLGIPIRSCTNWLSLAKTLFDIAKADALPNTSFHLWGHSHEIEKYDMWGELEAFLMHVQQSHAKCVVNNSLINYI